MKYAQSQQIEKTEGVKRGDEIRTNRRKIYAKTSVSIGITILSKKCTNKAYACGNWHGNKEKGENEELDVTDTKIQTRKKCWKEM